MKNCLTAFARSLVMSALVVLTTATAAQPQETSLFANGDLAVTGFSGTITPPPEPALKPGSSVPDETFIDLDGMSARIFARPERTTDATVTDAQQKLGLTAREIGQVFGVAMDDAEQPNTYLGATSAFGLQIVVPDSDGDGRPERVKFGQADTRWMDGQFGPVGTSGPGTIWKIDGVTGQVSAFVNIQSNTGPGLGNIAFDPVHQQLLVSDLDSGLLHRFDMSGLELGVFDHGVTGRGANGLEEVPEDTSNRVDLNSGSFDAENPSTWGFADPRRRVWGLAVHRSRVYYAIADGPQIWSVGIAGDGSFAADARREIDLRDRGNQNPVSDITFTPNGSMIIAQRGAVQSRYDYSRFHQPRNAQVLRFRPELPDDPDTAGHWILQPDEYAIGFAAANRNTAGGIGLSCDGMLWTTGDALRSSRAHAARLEAGGPGIIHGVQGNPLAAAGAANTPPWKSQFIDFDGKFDDPDIAGHVGDVAVLQRCTEPAGAVLAENTPPADWFPPLSCTETPDSPYCPQNKAYPDLEIVKYADRKNCKAGAQCGFFVEVRNVGDVAFFGPLWIKDAAGGGFLINAAPSPWQCGIGNAGKFDCWHPEISLLPGEAVGFNARIRVPFNWSAATYRNCATIHWPWWNGDADGSNDESCVVVNTPPGDLAAGDPGVNDPAADDPPIDDPLPGDNGADLAVIKRGPAKICNAGATCGAFRIGVRNIGARTYEAPVTIIDTFQDDATFDRLAANSPWSCTELSTTSVECTYPGSLAPGAAAPALRMHLKINPVNKRKRLVNCANLAGQGARQDVNEANNRSCASAQLSPADQIGDDPQPQSQFDLSIHKSGFQCKPGETCAFSVHVKNSGQTPYSGSVRFRDKIPRGLEITRMPQGNWSCTPSPAGIACRIDSVSLAAGSETPLASFSYKLKAAGIIENCAELRDPAADLDASNNRSCAQMGNPADDTDGRLTEPQLVVEKTGPATCFFDRDCAFTIKLTNPSTTQGLSGRYHVNESPQWPTPGGVEWIPAESPIAPIGTALCDPMPRTTANSESCATPVDLAPGETSSFKVKLLLNNPRLDPSNQDNHNNSQRDGVMLRNCIIYTRIGDPAFRRLQGCAEVAVLSPQDDPQGEAIDLVVKKTAVQSHCEPNLPCEFQVSIHNASDREFSRDVIIVDGMRQLGSNTTLVDNPITSDQTLCSSTALPFGCERQLTLAAGQTQEFKFSVKLGESSTAHQFTPDGKFENCFQLIYRDDQNRQIINKPCATVEFGRNPVDLVVSKTARTAECSLNGFCTFDINIRNASQHRFDQMVRMSDVMKTVEGNREVSLPIVERTLGLCDSGGIPRLPNICDRRIQLEPGEVKSESLTVRLGDSSQLAAGDSVENCFFLYHDDPAGQRVEHNPCVTVRIGANDNSTTASGLLITKTADTSTCERNQACTFHIAIRNTSTRTFDKPIRVFDIMLDEADRILAGLQATNTNQPFCQITSTVEVFRCDSHLTLQAGQSRNFSVTVGLDSLSRVQDGETIRNCFELSHRNDSDTDRIFQTVCAPVKIAGSAPGRREARIPPPDLSLSKTAAQSNCRAGQRCRYSLVVKNSRFSPYTGPLEVTDNISVAGARLVFSGPAPWSCTGASGRYTCRHPATEIAAGGRKTLSLTFALPRRTTGTVRNCAALNWRPGALNRLQVSAVQRALGDLGYSVGAIDGLTGPQTRAAIDEYRRKAGLALTGRIDRVLLDRLFTGWRDGGDADNRNDRDCVSTRVTRAPLNNEPQARQPVEREPVVDEPLRTVDDPLTSAPQLICPRGARKTGNRCVCRRPARWDRRSNTCRRPAAQQCRAGQTYDRKTRRCVTNLQCPQGAKKVRNRCICRAPAKWDRRSNTCRRPSVQQCRAGQTYDRKTRRCVTNLQCPQGAKKVRNRCICRAPAKWDRRSNTCRRPAVQQCRAGQTYDRKTRRCVTSLQCPRGAKKVRNRCICRPPAKWNRRNNTCVRPSANRPSTRNCRVGQSYDPDRRRCVSICRRGQVWNSRIRRCVRQKS